MLNKFKEVGISGPCSMERELNMQYFSQKTYIFNYLYVVYGGAHSSIAG
jgi:hypothetical protein